MHAEAELPRRHRLTVSDYYRMAEVGILDGEARVELIDGDIIDMAPPGSPHAATVHYLNEVLMRAAGGGRANVLVQNPVRLSDFSEERRVGKGGSDGWWACDWRTSPAGSS